MKLLITVKALTDGGAERVASLWANGFVTRGHEVIIVNNTNKNCSYSIDERVDIYNFHNDIKNKILSHILYIKHLRSLIKKHRPDVIINVLNPGAVYDYIAAIGYNIPIVNTEHNTFERPEYASFSRLEYFCKFYFNLILKKVTVLTQADKNIIGKRLNNIIVLPNPCTFNPVSTIPTKQKTILAVGRLDNWDVKGFDILIKAWSRIYNIHKDWTLNIMGSSFSGGRDFLSSLAGKYEVSNSIHFLDYNPDIINEYKSSSIFVLSSRYEGFGMVLLEAMSQGCACIACDYKGRQREIIGESQYGLICDVDNDTMLANQINNLIVDEKLRMDLQLKAIERSREYSIEAVLDKWEQILVNLR